MISEKEKETMSIEIWDRLFSPYCHEDKELKISSERIKDIESWEVSCEVIE